MAMRSGSTVRLLGLFLLAAGPRVARASEADVKGDVRSDTNDVKRGAKKATHRVDEAGCTGTKAECAKRKGKHRVEEAKDKASDKTTEAVDKTKDEVKEETK
jgi:hypothetical protein